VVLAFLIGGAAGDEIDGTITSGRAKALVDEALPLWKEADAVYKAWVLEKIPEADLVAELRRATALYDEAARKLGEAIEIRYDPSVNHLIRLIAQKMATMRFRTEFAAPPKPAPSMPDAPEAPATPAPAPAPPHTAPAPPPLPPAEEPVRFAEAGPPAVPVHAEMPPASSDGANAKRDRAAVAEAVRAYCDARREGRLVARHGLCRGKGCGECGGTGQQVNLHHFRKAFWSAFTPALRDAPGALDALKAFHARAQRDPAALGPLVKSFRIGDVAVHGWWAEARVEENTTDGPRERTLTLIGVGSSWFFFHPEADRELLPR
jgi:hypothetical protein